MSHSSFLSKTYSSLSASSVSLDGSMSVSGSLSLESRPSVVVPSHVASTTTLTAEQMKTGLITVSAATTSDSAANIISSIPEADVGSSLQFTVINTGVGASDLTAGTGVTAVGSLGIAIGASATFLARVDVLPDAEADPVVEAEVSIYRL